MSDVKWTCALKLYQPFLFIICRISSYYQITRLFFVTFIISPDKVGTIGDVGMAVSVQCQHVASPKIFNRFYVKHLTKYSEIYFAFIIIYQRQETVLF